MPWCKKLVAVLDASSSGNWTSVSLFYYLYFMGMFAEIYTIELKEVCLKKKKKRQGLPVIKKEKQDTNRPSSSLCDQEAFFLAEVFAVQRSVTIVSIARSLSGLCKV